MISHPFEIRSSASNEKPDVLMVTWRGTPGQSSAEIYLPFVSAQAIVLLADRIYGRHRLTATDANTLQFPASDLTLIPIPAGTGREAGLLSVDVRPSLPEGRTCTVAVRQLNQRSATSVSRPPPPPPTPIKIARVAVPDANDPTRPQDTQGETFYWRNVQGAFQYTITSESPKTLLLHQERLVAWLKWRIGVTPAQSRWLPVLERYLKYTEILVWTLGKDPNGIPPSQAGQVGGKGSGHEPPAPPHPHPHPQPQPQPPCDEHERECCGKVFAIDYDRFGDFRGFTILTEEGHERSFRATELPIEKLVRDAWVERTVVSVFWEEREPEYVARLVLHRHR